MLVPNKSEITKFDYRNRVVRNVSGKNQIDLGLHFSLTKRILVIDFFSCDSLVVIKRLYSRSVSLSVPPSASSTHHCVRLICLSVSNDYTSLPLAAAQHCQSSGQ